MLVSVFGATGRTGALVCAECLRREWNVRALVRDAKKISPQFGLDITRGDARSSKDVACAIAGADAILCCLGMHNIAVAATDYSESLRQIVKAMELTPTRRLLAIAWAGVLPTTAFGFQGKDSVPPYLNHVTAEHERNYETLKGSSLDWTLMCPTFLKADIPPGHSRFDFDRLPAGSNETGYADLAHLMVDLIPVTGSFRRCVGIVSDR